jgi:hypothetical protein
VWVKKGEKEAKRVDYTIITRYIKHDEYFNIQAREEEEAKQKTIWGKSNNNRGNYFP